MVLYDKSSTAVFCVKCVNWHNTGLFLLLPLFFLIGKVVLRNLPAARSLISLRRAVAQNFMSAHPTVIGMCHCRTEWWTDTKTQPSPQLRAWQSTSSTWMPISCSVSLPPCVILFCLLFPLCGVCPALPPSAQRK